MLYEVVKANKKILVVLSIILHIIIPLYANKVDCARL